MIIILERGKNEPPETEASHCAWTFAGLLVACCVMTVLSVATAFEGWGMAYGSRWLWGLAGVGIAGVMVIFGWMAYCSDPKRTSRKICTQCKGDAFFRYF